jgi:hypothetical protein
MKDKWFYFGCHRGPGHYLFREGMFSHYDASTKKLERFDGMLAPQQTRDPYIATVSRLGGWGFTALSFWDYSVDNRGGCNSIIFAPSLSIHHDDLLSEAEKRFPEVFNRLPYPVRLLPSGIAQ